jgi:YVTN family beta-propeller protein
MLFKKLIARFFALLFAVAMFAVCGAAAHAEAVHKTGSFRILTRFPLGGDGGWDYLTVDAQARRLYIARADRVMVIDADSGQSIGNVTGLNGAHGIALVQEQGVGFATSGKSGEVVVFDLKNLSVLTRIQAGENPDAVLYDPASQRVFAFNGKSKSITVIDAKTMKVVTSIPLHGKPEFAVSDGRGKVFFNLEDLGELIAFDSLKLKLEGTYPLKPCEEPTGLSMDSSKQRLIVGCGNSLAAIVGADTGHLQQTFNVGQGVDATAFDPGRKLAFVSAGADEGKLTVLYEAKDGFHFQQELQTVAGARTLAVDAKTGRIFLPFAQFVPVSPDKSPEGKPPGHSRAIVPGSFAVLVVGQ